MLTISNQLSRAPGEHPLTVDKRKLRKVSLHHLSWSQIRTEALIEQANKVVSDPDQAWILAEYIRYLEHPRSGAAEFDDMGAAWVAVREAARAATLQPGDHGAADVVRRFEQLVSFASMLMSRELGVARDDPAGSARSGSPTRPCRATGPFPRRTCCVSLGSSRRRSFPRPTGARRRVEPRKAQPVHRTLTAHQRDEPGQLGAGIPRGARW